MKSHPIPEPPTVRVTLSLPDETVAFARVEAARAGKSMSRWLADQVTEWWEADQASEKAMRRRPARRGPGKKARTKP